jgi:hypothetical protein
MLPERPLFFVVVKQVFSASTHGSIFLVRLCNADRRRNGIEFDVSELPTESNQTAKINRWNKFHKAFQVDGLVKSYWAERVDKNFECSPLQNQEELRLGSDLLQEILIV